MCAELEHAGKMSRKLMPINLFVSAKLSKCWVVEAELARRQDSMQDSK